VGDNSSGQCDVGNWTGIVQVAAGSSHTVGLKSDGTVLAVGHNYSGQCNVSNWTNITKVTAGTYNTVGVKADGTVVAVGYNFSGQCDVSSWTDIVHVAAGFEHTVGVKADGTVVAVGSNGYGQCNVGNWTNITKVTAGWGHTVGVKVDGTVVATGLNDARQCDVGDWKDIIQVAAGGYHTVGLKADGTVIAAGPESELAKWNLGGVALYLTISSTTGGNVTRPGEGTFPYYPGRVINLVAEPEAGYRFVKWTGDVDTIAHMMAAATIITMDNSYSITADFEEIPPINWPLISGIIVAVMVVGLVIFFVRRRRAT